MENKNKRIRAGFSTILCGVMAILLCAAPCGAKKVEIGDTLNVGTGYPDEQILNDWLDVYGTLNMYTGAYVDWGIYTYNGSTVNIHAGEIGEGYFIMVVDGSTVTVYGTDFAVDGASLDPSASQFTPDADGSVLTGIYDNDDPIDLLFYSDIPIYLAAPGGDSITVNIENAKVCWDHSDIHVEGKLYLPQGYWMNNLNPVGSAVIKLAGDEVADQIVDFEIAGKKDDKWEYKDEENHLKEFKIDWKGAKFDYKGDDKFHIHTHFIGGTETTLCIHCDDTLWPFTVTIDETTIEYDGNGDITGNIEGDDIDPQKDDNTHVHFTLPFQLTPGTPDITIEVSEVVVLSIVVANYYEEGFVKFKLISVFDSVLFPEGPGTLPDKLECVISLGLGDDMISGSDLISAWTKKDHKHWEYK